MQRRALAETADYIQTNMAEAIGYYSGKKVLEHALRLVPPAGHLVEFGVYKGGSINLIARHFPERVVHGFDSFHGLPHDWHGWRDPKGKFSLHGRAPRVRPNVKLHVGLFEETLPAWLELNPGVIAFAHLDCDLYSSAKTVLDLMSSRIGPGSVLVFDEYFNFPFWRDHEFRAFQDAAERTALKYRYTAYARTQVGIVVTAKGEPRSA